MNRVQKLGPECTDEMLGAAVRHQRTFCDSALLEPDTPPPEVVATGRKSWGQFRAKAAECIVW